MSARCTELAGVKFRHASGSPVKIPHIQGYVIAMNLGTTGN